MATEAGGARAGIGWFDRFGVTERTLREALAAALSRGGDFADLYFQHRVETDLALQDGAVNRGFASVELGVGVRVVKGDQTGYGYTEDLSLPAILAAARTAAAIADGASRDAPARMHLAPRLGGRYPSIAPGEGEGAAAHLPVLEQVNARLLAADPSVRKVNVHLHDERSAVLDRRLERPGGRGHAAHGAPLGVDPGRARRAARAERLQPLRPGRGQLLLEGPHRPALRRGLGPHLDPLRGRPAARRRDAGGARRRVVGDPAPRGHRPRHGGRLQPQGHLHLRRQDGQGRRRRPSSPSSTTAPGSARAGRSTSTTRATRPDARCWSRTACSPPTCTTPSRPATTAWRPPATAGARATATRRCRACARTYMLPGPHAKEEILRSVKRGIYCRDLLERAGPDRRRRLHLLREERLAHRGRQAHPADQGREPHRQRAEGPRAGGHGRRTTWSSTRAAGPAARTGRACRSRRGCPPCGSSSMTVGGRGAP